MQFARGRVRGHGRRGAGVITVTRTGPLTGTATVRYTASDDTAACSATTARRRGILTFLPGHREQDVHGADHGRLDPRARRVRHPDAFDPDRRGAGQPEGLQPAGSATTIPARSSSARPTYLVPKKVPGQKVVISVQRTGSLNATTTVLFQTIDGTATGGPVAVCLRRGRNPILQPACPTNIRLALAPRCLVGSAGEASSRLTSPRSWFLFRS